MPYGIGDLRDLNRLKEKTYCQTGDHQGERHQRGTWEDGEQGFVFKMKICHCLYCGRKMHEEVFK